VPSDVFNDMSNMPYGVHIVFKSTFAVLGILLGTATLISLFQNWTGTEIVSEIARDALSVYRQMLDSFHWALFSWWTPLHLPWGWEFEVPRWGLDLLTLWVLCHAAFLRMRPRVNEFQRDYMRVKMTTGPMLSPLTWINRLAFWRPPKWFGARLSCIVAAVLDFVFAPYHFSVYMWRAFWEMRDSFFRPIIISYAYLRSWVNKRHLRPNGFGWRGTYTNLRTWAAPFFVGLAPFLFTGAFFAWNAMLISPQ
jgi:hypothetical protein